MPTSTLSVVIQRVWADLRPEGAGLTDGELLARFLRSRDDAALAALVRGHAPMVWGVCRRLLSHHDAEDAFQATFLVLVRKAADVPRLAVANWLYGVARQTAVRLRATAAKRGRRESQVMTMPEPEDGCQRRAGRRKPPVFDGRMPPVFDEDLQVVVEEELSRLPDHYRGVIVLCDLEGMTRREAARHLGIPEGSVASRLARARRMLAKRLTRRGMVFSGGSVAAILSSGTTSASAPPALVANTIRAASLLAAGRAAGVVSAQVAALTEGVVRTMFVSKIKVVVGGFVLFALASLLTFQGLGDVLAGDAGATGQVPLAVPGGSEKKDVAVQDKRRLVVTASLKLKFAGSDEEEEFCGIIAVDPETGKWKKIVPLATGPGTGSGCDHRVSPDGETLAFIRNDGTEGVWTSDMKRAGRPGKISDLGGWGTRLVWSPKGERLIVNTSEHDKVKKSTTSVNWLMNADGSNAMKLPTPDTDGVADWSRDGKWLATVRSSPSGSRQVYLMRPDGKDQRQLTKDGGNSAPQFSPDSSKIAYMHHDKEDSGVWIMDVDGKNPQKIMVQEDLLSPTFACWSPDGKRLAVTAFKWQRDEKGKLFISDPAKMDYHLVIMDADGRNRRRLDIAGAKVIWIASVDWR